MLIQVCFIEENHFFQVFIKKKIQTNSQLSRMVQCTATYLLPRFIGLYFDIQLVLT